MCPNNYLSVLMRIVIRMFQIFSFTEDYLQCQYSIPGNDILPHHDAGYEGLTGQHGGLAAE